MKLKVWPRVGLACQIGPGNLVRPVHIIERFRKKTSTFRYNIFWWPPANRESPGVLPVQSEPGVAKHSSRPQSSINLHALVTAFMFNCSGTDVSPQRDEGSGKPCAVDIEPHRMFGTHSGLEPGTFGSTVQSINHYTTTAHSISVSH